MRALLSLVFNLLRQCDSVECAVQWLFLFIVPQNMVKANHKPHTRRYGFVVLYWVTLWYYQLEKTCSSRTTNHDRDNHTKPSRRLDAFWLITRPTWDSRQNVATLMGILWISHAAHFWNLHRKYSCRKIVSWEMWTSEVYTIRRSVLTRIRTEPIMTDNNKTGHLW